MNIFEQIRTKRQQKELYLKEIIAQQHRLLEELRDFTVNILTPELDVEYGEVYIPNMNALCERYFEGEEFSKGLDADFKLTMHLWRKMQKEQDITKEGP